MGNYLSRDAVLNAGVKTADVDAFGGTVLVSELDAALVQSFFEDGMIIYTDGVGHIDMAKLNFVEIAQHVIVDPEDPGKPLLKKADVERLARKSFSDIQAVALKAIEITDWGGKDEDEPKNSPALDASPIA